MPLGEFTQFVVPKFTFSCNTQFVDAGAHETVAKPGALFVMLSVGTTMISTKPGLEVSGIVEINGLPLGNLVPDGQHQGRADRVPQNFVVVRLVTCLLPVRFGIRAGGVGY